MTRSLVKSENKTRENPLFDYVSEPEEWEKRCASSSLVLTSVIHSDCMRVRPIWMRHTTMLPALQNIPQLFRTRTSDFLLF